MVVFAESTAQSADTVGSADPLTFQFAPLNTSAGPGQDTILGVAPADYCPWHTWHNFHCFGPVHRMFVIFVLVGQGHQRTFGIRTVWQCNIRIERTLPSPTFWEGRLQVFRIATVLVSHAVA